MDCGLIVENLRGSLAKLPGRTGTRGFRPLDLDLTVWIKGQADLILAARLRSDGQKQNVQGRRRVLAGDRAPAAAPRGARRRWSLPVFQGSKPSGLGSGRIYASCVIHPWHLLGSGRLRSEDAMAAEALRG